MNFCRCLILAALATHLNLSAAQPVPDRLVVLTFDDASARMAAMMRHAIESS